MRSSISRIISGLVDLVYPRICEVCGRSLATGEEIMCLHCLYGLPRTHVHRDEFNEIHRRLAGKVAVERAAAYFHYYRESGYAGIIHSGKYGGRPSLMRRMGARMARELRKDGFFDGVDMLLPVPLHPYKRFRRGYNQSAAIAQGVSDVTGIATGDYIRAARWHGSQTRTASMYDRWINARLDYRVTEKEALEGKHVMVVDDVITTGATILACLNAIHDAAPGCRISVLALGLAHKT